MINVPTLVPELPRERKPLLSGLAFRGIGCGTPEITLQT